MVYNSIKACRKILTFIIIKEVTNRWVIKFPHLFTEWLPECFQQKKQV
jgi:hypothetical protein